MDTKLKNRHKLAIILIILTILVPTIIITGRYPESYSVSSEGQETAWKRNLVSESFLEDFVRASYILYGIENREEMSAAEVKEQIRDAFPDWMSEFDQIYPYLEYAIKDADGEVIAQNTESAERTLSSGGKNSRYDFILEITYDEDGIPQAEVLKGDFREKQNVKLRAILNAFEENVIDEYGGDFEGMYGLYMPKNQTFFFGMTESNLKSYVGDWYHVGLTVDHQILQLAAILVFLVAVIAFFMPRVKSFHTGEERVFQAPIELPILVCFTALMLMVENLGYAVARNNGTANIWDYLGWACTFASVYWLVACLRSIFSLGFKGYMKERSFFVKSWGRIKAMSKRIWNKGKTLADRVYHSFEEIDFDDQQHRFILKVVLWNFVILVVICTMWVYGIMALIIYSVLLFLILRKYFNDLREKYKVLLKATNEIAEGNLDVEITEDLGVFRPFKAEIEKIQHGFKNAVQKEVKSQRMKTELITNVSHDLKTPLTAIITYVDLLKNEPDEEKRKEYLDVLERKSLRLKVLIEDLFEISKAHSENVTLDLVDVDIIHLFKQVKLELEDKIAGANLEFRCSYPEEKVMARLDSQKTYRIFENLLINIVKYAMPQTRVYVEIVKDGEHAVVRMKNISAQELNFNSDEITERFVRGDAARNTEGSGLGLAIVKSFVELQKGTFAVETDADLFKVEIIF